MEPAAIEIAAAGPHVAAEVAAIYAPIVTSTVISFETDPPSAEEMTRRIEMTLENYPWLIALVGGSVAGYAYAHAFAERPAYAWSAETSIYIRADFRGKGVGRDLYETLLQTLRRQGYCRVFAAIGLPNDASVGLHKAVGFEQIGVFRRVGWKRGAWHDVAWWQRDLLLGSDPPGRVIPFRELDWPR